MPDNSNQTYTKTFTLKIKATSEEVFPVICDTKDHSLYSAGKSELVYSISGLAEDNCIFQTSIPGEKNENIWLISSFDPGKEIQLVKYNILSVSLIKIILSDTDASSCSIEVKYSTVLINNTEQSYPDIQKETDEEAARFINFFNNKFECELTSNS